MNLYSLPIAEGVLRERSCGFHQKGDNNSAIAASGRVTDKTDDFRLADHLDTIT